MVQRLTRNLLPVLVFALAFGVASLTARREGGPAHVAAATKQPNLVTAKADLVPGQTTIFLDDFHDMAPGEPPPHWKVRQGHVSLALGGGKRELNGSANLVTHGIHFDTGSAAHNRALSQPRAAAARSVLVSQFGIAKGRLTAKGYGDAHPVATNGTAAGRAENRRVEFVEQGAKAGGSSKGASAYPGLPAGRLVKARWPSGAEMKLKRPEQIAAIFVFDIGDVEGSCHRHANHYCTIAGLVRGVKTKYWGTLRLKRNPLKDPNYRYELTIVKHSLNPVHVAAIPRKPGLGGWLSVGRGDFPDMYFNPTGPATTKSKKVRSFSTQVVLEHG